MGSFSCEDHCLLCHWEVAAAAVVVEVVVSRWHFSGPGAVLMRSTAGVVASHGADDWKDCGWLHGGDSQCAASAAMLG